MKKLLMLALSALLLAGCSSNANCPECEVCEPCNDPTVAEPVALPDARDLTKKYSPSEGAAEEACTADVYTNACAAITAENLVDYLGRDDVVYIDLRDFGDYAKKHLRNFECVPYFALIFDAEAGSEGKPQLFGGSVDEPVATYEESMALMEAMFPKDKTIFFMCQSGGRVAQMMRLLDALGYDMSKIYNVGGMGQYTDAKYAPFTTDSAEVVVEAVYSFEGLTPANN